jgi:hypothetical protein
MAKHSPFAYRWKSAALNAGKPFPGRHQAARGHGGPKGRRPEPHRPAGYILLAPAWSAVDAGDFTLLLKLLKNPHMA